MDFTKIYNENFSSIENYIKRKTNQSPNAFDYTQQTFMRLYDNQHKYPNLTDKKAIYMLFKIANNILIDEYRKNKIDTVSMDDEEKTFHISADTDKAKEIEEKSILINNALNELSPNVKKVFELFYFENYKMTEIAEMLSITQNHVKQILFQNKKKLRNILEKQLD